MTQSLRKLQREADKDAREKFLAYSSTHVLEVGDALIEKARAGDVSAIKEFFDRIWGKAPQAVNLDVHHTFSLVALGKERDALDTPEARAIQDAPQFIEP